jgi:excisionase family DNA binding protein
MPLQKENSSGVAPLGDRLLSSKEVCSRLNISTKTLQRICKRGAINFIRISGSLYRFRPAAVELFLSRSEVKAVRS